MKVLGYRFSVRTVQFVVGVAILNSTLYGLALAEAFQVGLPFYEFARIGLRLTASLFWGAALAVVLLSPPRWLGVLLLGAIGIVICVFTTISVYHFISYGEPTGLTSLMAIADSNTAEAVEFIQGTASSLHIVSALAAGFVLASLTLFCLWRLMQISVNEWSHIRLTMTVLAAFAAVTKFGANDPIFSTNSPILFLGDSGSKIYTAYGELKKLHRDNMEKIGATGGVAGAVHIIIMGESVTSRHMSIYGYERNTTPQMIRPRDHLRRFVIFDACSTAPGTAPALQDIFTGGTRGELIEWNRPNLLSIAAEVALRTYWISNQSLIDDSNTISSAWGTISDERKYLTQRGWKNTQSFDERLIPELHRVLSDKSG